MEVVHNLDNEATLYFSSVSQNESFARMVVSAFIAQCDPTLDELSDIKTAVSEAVTNAIIHGYENKEGKIRMHLTMNERTVSVEIEDFGLGIHDVQQALTPMFTSKPDEERSGMGFTFMGAFMDTLDVISELGRGTLIRMTKTFRS